MTNDIMPIKYSHKLKVNNASNFISKKKFPYPWKNEFIQKCLKQQFSKKNPISMKKMSFVQQCLHIKPQNFYTHWKLKIHPMVLKNKYHATLYKSSTLSKFYNLNQFKYSLKINMSMQNGFHLTISKNSKMNKWSQDDNIHHKFPKSQVKKIMN